MDSVSKTLYIPLYGKALVSRLGLILRDPKAEEIWEKEGFPLKGKAASKWLAIYMAMRAAVFDDWTKHKLEQFPDAVVLHIGCGMDSRVLRVGGENRWYDVDFPEVIEERRRYYAESGNYRMIPADMRREDWKQHIPGGDAIIVMEGVSMYFRPEELEGLLKSLAGHFASVHILMDCYSSFAARASKYKNPINEVGVTTVYGMDGPEALARVEGLTYVKEHSMTPVRLMNQLKYAERIVFSNLYAGRLAKKLYRLYELIK